MFGKKEKKNIGTVATAKPPAGMPVGGDTVISKVQEMGMVIVNLRSELSKVSTELSARMAQVDTLQQGLDMANGRVAILEGVIANTFNSVMEPQPKAGQPEPSDFQPFDS